ncbi:MAG: DUF2281 domain-containing protein [Bacteroidia bacterium]|nr:DUF2281 domain-containing protein [Bacteroidia bacterium]
MSSLEMYLKLVLLPENLRKEVGLYMDFLVSKSQAGMVDNPPRKAGLAKGLIRMSPDFDEPLDDFKAYME